MDTIKMQKAKTSIFFLFFSNDIVGVFRLKPIQLRNPAQSKIAILKIESK